MVNLKEINIFDNNYKEIDWKDYNWLVVAYKLKDRHILKIHLQLYKRIENFFVGE